MKKIIVFVLVLSLLISNISFAQLRRVQQLNDWYAVEPNPWENFAQGFFWGLQRGLEEQERLENFKQKLKQYTDQVILQGFYLGIVWDRGYHFAIQDIVLMPFSDFKNTPLCIDVQEVTNLAPSTIYDTFVKGYNYGLKVKKVLEVLNNGTIKK